MAEAGRRTWPFVQPAPPQLSAAQAIAHNFDVSSRAWYLLASAKLNLAMGWAGLLLLLLRYC